MIPKSQMYLGARIVENDPEEETPVVPYKGTVTAIEETGKGELDYFVYIRLDDEICSVLDYFEIFMERMLMCRRAAEVLGTRFKLTANGSKVL